jgi:formate hydrogenlyase transcriptional activator
MSPGSEDRPSSKVSGEGLDLGALFEVSPDAVVAVTQSGEIVLANAQTERLFGYGRKQLLKAPIKILIPERFRSAHPTQWNRLFSDPRMRTMEGDSQLFGLRKDGSEFPAEIILSPFVGVGESLATATIRDISARKTAEEHLAQVERRRKSVEDSLRECEERYRMLLDGIEHYAIFAMDSHGQIVSWNAGAERIKGYKAAEIIGQNFSCFFPPEDIERGRPQEILRMAAVAGRQREQAMCVRKDGSRFLASLTFVALRDSDGTLRGFSEFSHDLSESEEAEAKYRGLLEAAPDAMVVVNEVGEIVLLNL